MRTIMGSSTDFPLVGLREVKEVTSLLATAKSSASISWKTYSTNSVVSMRGSKTPGRSWTVAKTPTKQALGGKAIASTARDPQTDRPVRSRGEQHPPEEHHR